MLSFKMKIQRRIAAISFGTYFTLLFPIRSSIFHSSTRVAIHNDLRLWNRFNPFDNRISCIGICLIGIMILFDFYSILEALIRFLDYSLWASDCTGWWYTFMLRPYMEVKRWSARVVLTASAERFGFFKWHWIWLCQLFNLSLNGIVVDPWALGRLFKF